MDPEILPSDDA